MATPRCTSDSHGATAHNTVFIDTSLDTHLALIVSNSDTVSELKKKILYEHPLCFPNTGDIKIHALKVKRKGYFYHLSDSMFVKNAFDGVKNSWFLSADASSLVEHSQNCHSRKNDSAKQIACIGIRNNPSADGVELLPAGPPKSSSNFNDSSLPQIGGSSNMNQEVPVADQFGSGGSDREVSKDLMMEVNLISKDHFKSSSLDANKRSDLDRKVSKDLEMEVSHASDDHFKASSPDANKRSDPEIQEKIYLCSNDYEAPRTRTELNEDNSRKGTSDMQCIVPLEGAVKSGPVAKKKRKTKRKIEDAVDDHTLKESNASVSGKDMSQQGTMVLENSLGNAGGEVSCNMEMGNENIAGEPCKSLPSDTGKRSGPGVEKHNDLFEGIEVSGKHVECENKNSENGVVDVQCNNSLGEVSQAKPAKKKRKIEKKNGNEDSSKQNKSLISEPNKETSKPEITVPESTLGNKEKGRIDTLDGLSAEPLEDVHSLRTSSNSGKKRRKNKLADSHNQVVAVVPSSVKEVTEEISVETVGTNHKDLGEEPKAAIVPGRSVQGATVSDPCVVSFEEKHCNPVQEEVTRNNLPFSLDIDIGVADAGNVEGKSDGSKVAAVVGVKKKKSSKNGSVVDTKDQPAVVIKEPSHLDEKDTNINEGVITSKLLDVNGILEPGSEKKRKKSRKTKSSVGATQVTPGTQHARNSGSGISPEPPKALNGYHFSEKAEKEGSILSQREGKEVSKIETVSTNRKTDEVGKNETEFLQQISKTQENTENLDEKMRKKTKKRQSCAAKSLPSMQTRDQDVGCKDPVQSTDNTREVDASSKMKKKTKSAKTNSMNRLNGSNMEPEKDTVGESNQINFNDYFVPSQHQHEVNASGTRAILEKSNIISSAPSSSLDSSKDVIHLQKRGNEHQSRELHHRVPIRKTSAANKGEVVNHSQNKKSLLARSGMIFKDDGSESSHDKGGVCNSDATTRSPSDNSSSSDYSDVESNANFNSQQNGFYSANRKEGGGKGIIEPYSSTLKSMTMDTILRSSSRYKKAKLTASQSQLETESQPVDFVPDSQAIQ